MTARQFATHAQARAYQLKRMRDYAFRQLRRHAAMVERCLARATDRTAGIRGLGTSEFHLTQASIAAEQARNAGL